MNLDKVEQTTAKPFPIVRRAKGVGDACGLYRPSAGSTHATLLSNARPVVEAHLVTECRTSHCDPVNAFFVVVDLKGDFGRRLGLHVLDRVTLERRVRRAMARGGPPSLTVPVALEHGVALVELLAPEWLLWLDGRPPLSVAILAVDADDVPRLAFGCLRDGRLH
jgi:hypothetical protein